MIHLSAKICESANRRKKGKLGDAAIHSDFGFPASRHETEKEVGTDRNIKKGTCI